MVKSNLVISLVPYLKVKFMFSKKATKIEEIFTVNLTSCKKVKSTVKISSIFVAFLENTNFMELLIGLEIL